MITWYGKEIEEVFFMQNGTIKNSFRPNAEGDYSFLNMWKNMLFENYFYAYAHSLKHKEAIWLKLKK